METDQIIIDLKLESLEIGNSTNYLTHNFHPYPAKFVPKVPNSTILAFTKQGETILDPFCGCGTTLVEAKLLNRNAIGVDLNPIAVLASKAKTTKISQYEIHKINRVVESARKDVYKYYSSKLIVDTEVIPKFDNINHWFQNNVISELAIIKSHIKKVEDEKLRNYLFTAFSAIIVNVSNQESDTRFAAINKKIEQFKTIDEFEKKIIDMNKRITEFSALASDSKISAYLADSSNLNFIDDDSIDHIVTSPPYANTYDYYLYHKFRIQWLDYNLKEFQDNEIGSRNRHSSKKEDISTFEDSMLICLREMNRVLKRGKIAVIVIGDSVIRGEMIRANTIINKIANQSNFAVIKEISYPLEKVSRMFNPKFTTRNKLEYIIFLKNLK